MSDTPRTDAEEYYPHCSKSMVCNASFCRQLERELISANVHIKRLIKAGERLSNEGPTGRNVLAWELAKESEQ